MTQCCYLTSGILLAVKVQIAAVPYSQNRDMLLNKSTTLESNTAVSGAFRRRETAQHLHCDMRACLWLQGKLQFCFIHII
uniref:Secreted protein n=1 Tax=Anguilla anguilla TaxID=7936 RepID=A0A0E9RTL2_ANGAN